MTAESTDAFGGDAFNTLQQDGEKEVSVANKKRTLTNEGGQR